MELSRKVLLHLIRRQGLPLELLKPHRTTISNIPMSRLIQRSYSLSAHYCRASQNDTLTNNTDTKGKYEKSENESSTSSSESSSESSEENFTEHDLEQKILDTALNYVGVSGWSSEAIAKSAEELQYSSMVHGLFSQGGLDLVNHFHKKCNIELENQLQIMVKENEKKNGKTGTTEFIKNGLELRLKMNEKYIDSFAQALALHSQPKNAKQAIKSIGTTVDHIWFYAGDKSYDFNWYTKRASVAAIYKTAEIFMLQDKSPNFEDTVGFVKRRSDEMRLVANLRKEVGARSNDIKSVGRAAVTTALNVIGLNLKSRL